jgi:hypothetical protein
LTLYWPVLHAIEDFGNFSHINSIPHVCRATRRDAYA